MSAGTLTLGPARVCKVARVAADPRLVLQAVLESGSGRDINRHKYGMEEAEEALKQPVVQALLDLCKFRNTHQAFLGDVSPPLLHCKVVAVYALWIL